MSNKITVKELREKISTISDDTIIDLINDNLYNLVYPNSTFNKFLFVIGDWSEDGHNHYDEFTYMSETPLVDLQNAFKEACREYGLNFDCNNTLKVETDFKDIFAEYEDRSISIDLLKHMEDIGIDIENIFDYDQSDFMGYKHTGVLESSDAYSTENEFASLPNGPDDLPKLLIEVIKLKLPDVKIEYDPIQAKNVKPFNGWWIENEMNFGIGYGLYWA